MFPGVDFSSPSTVADGGGGGALIGITAMLVDEGTCRSGSNNGNSSSGGGGSAHGGGNNGSDGDSGGNVIVYCGRADGHIAVCGGSSGGGGGLHSSTQHSTAGGSRSGMGGGYSGGSGGKTSVSLASSSKTSVSLASSSNSSILGIIQPPAQWNGCGGGVRLLRLISHSTTSSGATDVEGNATHLFVVYDNGTWARYTRTNGRRPRCLDAAPSNGGGGRGDGSVGGGASVSFQDGEHGSCGWQLSAAAPGPHPEFADIFKLEPR